VSSVLPPASEKPRYVAAMFGRIARRYDAMNTLMTLGLDDRWRAVVARSLDGLAPSARVLDVGTGTGRLASAIQGRFADAHVVGADFTLPMLRRAPKRLEVVAADGLQLPFADALFDVVVSAFVVRNLADIQRGLAEQVRVLRSGGTLAILETTPGPARWPMSVLYRLYFRQVVPLIGGLIAGDASAYTYLPESSLRFVEPTRLAEALGRSGLEQVHIRRMALGCVAVTVAHKPRYASDRSTE
jgi:demethylmenaquinone methyltransferase/2-methoxy-6-polyprenyl-1,4-benzoquinol methylase